MPSSKYGRSCRRLLLVIVFQLGMCLVVLDDVVNAARGYGVFGIATIVGGVTAAGALLALLESLLSAGDSADPPK